MQEAVEWDMLTHENEMLSVLENMSAEASTEPANPFDILSKTSLIAPYSYYVFKDDSIVAWHNATLQNAAIRPQDITSPILKTDNGLYFVIQDTATTSYDLFVLFKIRSHYPYDNEYLTDAFDPSLRIGKNAQLSLRPSGGGCDISDAAGNFLFSIRNAHTEVKGLSLLVEYLLLGLWLLLSVVAIVLNAQYLVQLIGRTWTLVVTILAELFLYVLTLIVKPSSAMAASFLLSPQVFAYDWWIPSIAHLLILALLLLVWSTIFFTLFRMRRPGDLSMYLLCLLLFSVFVAANGLIDAVVRHSSDIILYIGDLELSPELIAKLLVIFFSLIGFMLVMERATVEMMKQKDKILNILSFFVLLGVICYFLYDREERLVVWAGYIILNMTFRLMKRQAREVLRFSHFVWMLYIVSAFILLRLTYMNAAKERQNRQLLADNLSFQMLREDDPAAEQLLGGIGKAMQSDRTIRKAVRNQSISETQLYTYLRQRYFDGYFSRYDLQALRCMNANCSLQEMGTGERYGSIEYFDDIINRVGRQCILAPNFYCLQDDDGLPCYLGQFNYATKDDEVALLYVQIDLRPTAQQFGYPALLMNKRDVLDISQYKGYSYAKYYDNRLAQRYGDYNYSLRLEPGRKITYHQYVSDGYSHLVYSPQDRQTIVLSYPKLTIQKLLANYAYIFIGLLLVSCVILIPISIHSRVFLANLSLKELIYASFISLVLLLFIVICVMSGMESMNRYESESREQLSRQMDQISEAVSRVQISETDMDNVLKNTQSSFFADCHFYDSTGRLVGTSKREIFAYGLMSPLMNDEALLRLRKGMNSAFVREKIGTLEYYSLYAPILSSDNEIIGYLNIPYFTDVRLARRQLFSTLDPITNSLLLVTLMSIVFSYFLVRGITLPLKSLSDRIGKVDLGRENVKLNYKYDDEIGQIVTEYNRMTDQLARSAEKLAATERESTWREMARQIAHEIKNPLTPMKLSVQYLIKVWDARRDNFEQILRKTSTTLIEQIDQLATVASQFSDIAKNQRTIPQRMDIAAKVQATVDLFRMSENATVSYEGPGEGIEVFADPDQMRSVFNNLIKNALQSVPSGQHVTIRVTLRTDLSSVFIDVADDGNGIPEDVREKIFRPNFTTKSTGMGLGLSLTKTIVINAGGEITFDTEVGKGTTFHIRLPLLKQ